MATPSEKFKAFISNTANIDKAKNIIPSNGMILLEIFMYKQEGSSLITPENTIDQSGKKGGFNYWPIAKVLAVAEGSKYKVGNIVKLSSDVSGTPRDRTSERETILAHNAKYPGEYRDPGHNFEGGIADTTRRYGFSFNPLDREELKDSSKILIGTHHIECIMDIELIK